MKKITITGLILISVIFTSKASADENGGNKIPNIFSAGRIGMTQSVDLPLEGELYFLISHRFGEIKGGFYDLFGLDLATIRLGFDYGINDAFSVGFGRSTWEKSYDIFGKIALLKQSGQGSPVALTLNIASSVSTIKNFYPEDRDGLWSRSSISGQLLIAHKHGIFSFQTAPMFFRNNFEVRLEDDLNLFALPLTASLKVSKRIAITTQYIPIFNKPSFAGDNPFTVGFDIDTGGHMFQLNFSNSIATIEKALLTNTQGDWFKGRIYFGFNLSRVFYLK